MQDDDTELDARIKAMISGYRRTQVVYLMVKLGIPGKLRDGAAHAGELAALCDADPGTLLDLLRALTADGLLEETAPGTEAFLLTPLGARLCQPSLASSALFGGEEWYRAWGAGLSAVRGGSSGFEAAYGVPFWQYLTARPGTALAFGRLMTSSAENWIPAFAADERFGSLSTIVDVGGGHGHVLAAILRSHPRLSGVLFDVPSAAETGTEVLRAAGVLGRCAVRDGSFFDAVPGDGDGYLLCRVLCDWPDQDAARILARCRRGMRDGSSLFVVGRLTDGGATAGNPVLDLHMRFLTGGRERSRYEYESLLTPAGFTIRGVSQVGGTDLSVIWAATA